jgi:hypothetical protein
MSALPGKNLPGPPLHGSARIRKMLSDQRSVAGMKPSPFTNSREMM